MAGSGIMSVAAEAILQQFKLLSQDERTEVLRELEAQRAEQMEALRRFRGSCAGAGLLEALLASRAEDRARERAEDEARLRAR